MAIDAAVDGLGVVLESEILAATELGDGRLIAPFGDGAHTVETTSYFLVRSPGFRTRTQIAAFEKWLRAAIADSQPYDQDKPTLATISSSADGRSVEDAALGPQLIEPAVDFQRAPHAQVPLEGFAVVPPPA